MGTLRVLVSGLGILLAFSPLYAQAREFRDVDEGDRYSEAIDFVAEEGIATGYSDGTFRPQGTINRAEFLRMVMESSDMGSGGSYCFHDVMNEWFARYICAARQRGVVQGYSDGTFRPDWPITGNEAASIISRAHNTSIHNMSPSYLTRGETAMILWELHGGESDDGNGSEERDFEDSDTFFHYDDDDIEDLEDIDDLPNEEVTAHELMVWDDVLMGIVKRRFFSPPENARAYAALAIAQRDVILIGEEVDASSKAAIDLVSHDILCHLFPQDCASLDIDPDDDRYARRVSALVSQKMIERLTEDPIAGTLTPPTGSGFWKGTHPVAPYVLDWEYLLVDEDDVEVPAPPRFGSDDDEDELDEVRDALDDLSSEELAMAFRWDYPENVTLLFADVAHEYLHDENASLLRTADVRFVLYTSISEAFTAAWKAKYTYWTARPEQRDPSIKPRLPTPNFPSYPSGHSSLSGAAYGTLKYFYPSKKEEIKDMAVTNRDARVWGGVHFPIDDIEGMNLGEEVAEEVIDWYEDQ